MLLTPQETNSLLETIHNNQAIFIGKQFGIEFLSEYDKALLQASGVDWENLYSPENDSLYSAFHLGMLAQALGDVSAMNKLTYPQLQEYVKGGEYIPITEREKLVINAIKNQTLSDIRSLNGRIFQDINGILTNTHSQQEFIKQELEEGEKKKKTLREISNDISRKTGDWSRDFDRIVEFQANSAYQEGRASWIKKEEGNDAEVYKIVFASACKHCLKLYTTAGYQSEPITFKLSELKANGTNIGRKVAEWKPVVGSTHPFCRCLLFFKRKGYLWNKATQSFDIKDTKAKPILKTPRKPIRTKIAGKEVSL